MKCLVYDCVYNTNKECYASDSIVLDYVRISVARTDKNYPVQVIEEKVFMSCNSYKRVKE